MNGIVDVKGEFHETNADNIVQLDNRHYRIAPFTSDHYSPTYFKNYESEKILEFIHTWAQINSHFNVVTLVCYAIAILLRPAYYKEYKHFPMLFLYGPAGTGKTTNLELFGALLGFKEIDKKTLNKNMTHKFLTRTMSNISVLPVFFDDFRNPTKSNNVTDISQMALNWFEGIGGGMAMKSIDTQTVNIDITAFIVFTGNDIPSDEALLSRLLLLHYDKQVSADLINTANNLLFNRNILSGLTTIVLKNVHPILSLYFDNIKQFTSLLVLKGFSPRQAQIWSMMVSAYVIFNILIPGIKYDIDKYIEDIIRNNQRFGTSENELAIEFVKLVYKFFNKEFVINRGRIITESHAALFKNKDDLELFAFSFDDVFDIIQSEPYSQYKSISKRELKYQLENISFLHDKSYVVKLNGAPKRCMAFYNNEIKKRIGIDVTE